jgi:hypothetical protein
MAQWRNLASLRSLSMCGVACHRARSLLWYRNCRLWLAVAVLLQMLIWPGTHVFTSGCDCRPPASCPSARSACHRRPLNSQRQRSQHGADGQPDPPSPAPSAAAQRARGHPGALQGDNTAANGTRQPLRRLQDAAVCGARPPVHPGVAILSPAWQGAPAPQTRDGASRHCSLQHFSRQLRCQSGSRRQQQNGVLCYMKFQTEAGTRRSAVQGYTSHRQQPSGFRTLQGVTGNTQQQQQRGSLPRANYERQS